MLWDACTMIGYSSLASDGELGTVSDLLFDDTHWHVRWMVIDTGHWSARREVLLPMSVLGRPDPIRRRLAVELTRSQIEACPAASEHPPVSRWPASPNDPHLRSVEAVVGHRVHLLDGLIGHIEELLVDDADWLIRYVSVDTCRWRPGDRLLLAPRSVREIDWSGRLVRFDVGRRELESGQPVHDAIWMRSASHAGTHADA